MLDQTIIQRPTRPLRCRRASGVSYRFCVELEGVIAIESPNCADPSGNDYRESPEPRRSER